MPEAPEGNNTPTPEEILASIHAGLKGETVQTRLDAIQKLGEQNFSSPAIIRTLETLAIDDKSKTVRVAARQALDTPAHRYIQSQISERTRPERKTILSEIDKWESQDMIQANLANVLRQRYDFDLKPVTPASEPVASTLHPKPEPAPASQAVPTPRLSLTQTLLSETSIKIALYLGAFFVIAAAAILAAIVEAARLPILLAATASFAGGAIVTRTRLPQPSFALFIVFSFLLPD